MTYYPRAEKPKEPPYNEKKEARKKVLQRVWANRRKIWLRMMKKA